MCVWCVCGYVHRSAGTGRGQRSQVPLEWELQAVINCLMRILGAELGWVLCKSKVHSFKRHNAQYSHNSIRSKHGGSFLKLSADRWSSHQLQQTFPPRKLEKGRDWQRPAVPHRRSLCSLGDIRSVPRQQQLPGL